MSQGISPLSGGGGMNALGKKALTGALQTAVSFKEEHEGIYSFFDKDGKRLGNALFDGMEGFNPSFYGLTELGKDIDFESVGEPIVSEADSDGWSVVAIPYNEKKPLRRFVDAINDAGEMCCREGGLPDDPESKMNQGICILLRNILIRGKDANGELPFAPDTVIRNLAFHCAADNPDTDGGAGKLTDETIEKIRVIVKQLYDICGWSDEGWNITTRAEQ